MLLNDGLHEFLLECEVRNYTPKTIRGYQNGIRLLLRFLQDECGVAQIEDVSTAHLKHFFLRMQRAGRKSSYLNGLHKSFRSWFSYLTTEGLLAENPILPVKWAREEKTVIQPFSKDEVRRMVQAFADDCYFEVRNKAMLCVLLDTGIRCSELIGLRRDDVREQDIRIMGKGRKERFVPKSPYLARQLLRYERMRDAYFACRSVPDNLFLSRTGRPLTTVAVERVVHIAGERAQVRPGVRCSPHTCRHYFSQAQLKNGSDVYSLSRLLGHSNIRITNRYLMGMDDAEIVRASVGRSPLMNL